MLDDFELAGVAGVGDDADDVGAGGDVEGAVGEQVAGGLAAVTADGGGGVVAEVGVGAGGFGDGVGAGVDGGAAGSGGALVADVGGVQGCGAGGGEVETAGVVGGVEVLDDLELPGVAGEGVGDRDVVGLVLGGDGRGGGGDGGRAPGVVGDGGRCLFGDGALVAGGDGAGGRRAGRVVDGARVGDGRLTGLGAGDVEREGLGEAARDVAGHALGDLQRAGVAGEGVGDRDVVGLVLGGDGRGGGGDGGRAPGVVGDGGRCLFGDGALVAGGDGAGGRRAGRVVDGARVGDGRLTGLGAGDVEREGLGEAARDVAGHALGDLQRAGVAGVDVRAVPLALAGEGDRLDPRARRQAGHITVGRVRPLTALGVPEGVAILERLVDPDGAGARARQVADREHGLGGRAGGDAAVGSGDREPVGRGRRRRAEGPVCGRRGALLVHELPDVHLRAAQLRGDRLELDLELVEIAREVVGVGHGAADRGEVHRGDAGAGAHRDDALVRALHRVGRRDGVADRALADGGVLHALGVPGGVAVGEEHDDRRVRDIAGGGEGRVPVGVVRRPGGVRCRGLVDGVDPRLGRGPIGRDAEVVRRRVRDHGAAEGVQAQGHRRAGKPVDERLGAGGHALALLQAGVAAARRVDRRRDVHRHHHVEGGAGARQRRVVPGQHVELRHSGARGPGGGAVGDCRHRVVVPRRDEGVVCQRGPGLGVPSAERDLVDRPPAGGNRGALHAHDVRGVVARRRAGAGRRGAADHAQVRPG